MQTPFACATASCLSPADPFDPTSRSHEEADRFDAAFELLRGHLPVVYSAGNHDLDDPPSKAFSG